MSATKAISKPQQHRIRISPLIRYLRLALVPVIILALSLIPRQSSTAQAGWQWYKTDTHTHSSISADGYVDLGILSQEAKDAGYNALFLTDHNLASEFPAHGIAYNRPFEDSYLHWNKGVFGTHNLTTNELTAAPVRVNRHHPLIRAAAVAVGKAFGTPPCLVRSGGTNPAVGAFHHTFRVPTALVGFGLPDDHIHAPNEKFHLPNFHKGIATSIRFLQEVGGSNHMVDNNFRWDTTAQSRAATL